MLSNRCRNILVKTLSSAEALRVRDFSEQFMVSERTIRNNLAEIDDFLRSNGLPPLNRDKDGVSFLGDERDINLLKNIISGENMDAVILTPDERLLEILYELAVTNGFITLEQQAQRLGVSKSTVVKDFEHLKTALCRDKVSIVSGLYGNWIAGNESAIRMAVVNMFISRMDQTSRMEALKMLTQPEKLVVNKASIKIFESPDPTFIMRCLEITGKSLDKKLTDDNCLILAGNLSMQLTRIKCGFSLKEEDSEMNAYTLSYKIANDIAKQYKSAFDIELSEPEKRHICRVLEYVANETLSLSDRINRAEVQIVGCYIIENMSKQSGRNFMYDYILLGGISNEILTILLKQKLGLSVKNPLLLQIQNKDAELYKSLTRSLHPLESLLGRKATPDETGFLAAHFLDALQRAYSPENGRPNVLIVCSEGDTLMKMLCNRIASRFDVNIVDAVGYGQVHSALAVERIDYLVSTVDIKYEGASCIHVSPLLTQEDENLLKQYLPTRVIDARLVEKICDAVRKSCTVQDSRRLMQDIYAVLGISNIAGYDASEMPALRTVLKPANIVVDYPAKDWTDAVHKASEILYENGYIEYGGIKAMERSMRELGENAVISPGIVFPHSKSYELTHRVGLSMVRLRKPVRLFESNEMIDIVFALAALDNKTHLVALSQLAQFLNNEDKLAILRGELTPEVMSRVLEDGLNSNNKGEWSCSR